MYQVRRQIPEIEWLRARVSYVAYFTYALAVAQLLVLVDPAIVRSISLSLPKSVVVLGFRNPLYEFLNGSGVVEGVGIFNWWQLCAGMYGVSLAYVGYRLEHPESSTGRTLGVLFFAANFLLVIVSRLGEPWGPWDGPYLLLVGLLTVFFALSLGFE